MNRLELLAPSLVVEEIDKSCEKNEFEGPNHYLSKDAEYVLIIFGEVKE